MHLEDLVVRRSRFVSEVQDSEVPDGGGQEPFDSCHVPCGHAEQRELVEVELGRPRPRMRRSQLLTESEELYGWPYLQELIDNWGLYAKRRQP